jgi:hypothetical protein
MDDARMKELVPDNLLGLSSEILDRVADMGGDPVERAAALLIAGAGLSVMLGVQGKEVMERVEAAHLATRLMLEERLREMLKARE